MTGASASSVAAWESAYPIVLVDPDPVFRLGLKAGLAKLPGLTIAAEAGDAQLALAQLASLLPQEPGLVNTRSSKVKLVILEAQLTLNDPQTPWLWQRLKQLYPQLPLLLLASPAAISLIDTAQACGVEGFMARGSEMSQIMAAVNTIRAGEPIYTLQAPRPSLASQYPNLVTRWQYHLIQDGLTEMDTMLQALQTYLGQPQLSPLHRLVCQGRSREIRTARWLVAQFLPQPRRPSPPQPPPSPPPPPLPTQFLDQWLERAQTGLVNQTGEPLELDILKAEKKQELLLVILQQWEDILTALQAAQLTAPHLREKRPQILRDLWQQSIRSFFGPYATLPNQEDLVIPLLGAQTEVAAAILDKIPRIDDLLTHLLWQEPLIVDNTHQAWGTPIAQEHLGYLLDNLILQTAAAILQPLLNTFPHNDTVKAWFYDRRVLSFRDMERFRNALSWKYRWHHLVSEPQEIFESQASLLILTPTGIRKLKVYIPRTTELQELGGVRYAVTLALEAHDAISPPLRSAIALIGQGFVYVLTQVIGRGLGLIGRGIVQGLGQTFSLPANRSKSH